ncbi:MAG: MFS transporter, partial [Eubacteriales bacterium]|nr:MFS transporter [Eubacteriales bacterium]
LIVTLAMLFFMSGYTATTGLGIYYFKYIYGDENMYSVFALILGVSQIIGLAVFPLVSNRMKRRSVFTLSIALVLFGYAAFYFSPADIVYIGIAGIFIFVGQAFIQVLMLMFIADSVEYGQWKFGKRNESVTFSLQPLIYKVSNALATGLIGFTVIRSGIKEAELPGDVTAQGSVVLKNSMLVYPAIFIVIAFVIVFFFYKIDESFYAKILKENKASEEAILAEQAD